MSDAFDAPVGSSEERNLAPLDLRWLAAAVDVALLGAGTFGGSLLGYVVGPVFGGAPAPTALASAMVGGLVPTVISWILVTVDGQSLGKRWTGLRIVTRAGRSPGFLRGVVVRSWVFVVLNSLCGFLVFVDPAPVLFGERRALHDLLAGTWVVVDDPTG